MKKLLILFLGLLIIPINVGFTFSSTIVTSSRCPMEYLGGSWEGYYISHAKYKIVMHVTKINGCDFEGHIDWLDYGNSQTKINGYYKDGKLHFFEIAKIQGPSHRLNTHYIASWFGEPEFTGNTYYEGNKIGYFQLRRFLS